MKISEIKSNESNPRFIRDDKFQKLVISLLTFPEMLELRPIVLDENNIILGGNMRFKALESIAKLNIQSEINKMQIAPERANHLIAFWVAFQISKEVKTVKSETLTAEQKNEFIIKDNTSFGDWDMDILANEFEQNLLEDWGVELPIQKVDLENIEKLEGVNFAEEFNKIKNDDAKTAIVKEFGEDYNAFIIICKDEIDELYLRNLFGITETIGNEHGLDNRKTNVLTVEDIKRKWMQLK